MTKVERRMRFVLEPHRPALDFRALAARFAEMCIELGWLRARSLHRREPRVETYLEGLEHLPGSWTNDSGGEGVVLWGMSFCGTLYVAGERLAATRNTRVSCLGRSTKFARGAPRLAHRTGSSLLPVTVHREDVLTYRATIEEPVEVDRLLPRDRFIEQAAVEFPERVGQNILEHPSDWDWYRHTVPHWEREAT